MDSVASVFIITISKSCVVIFVDIVFYLISNQSVVVLFALNLQISLCVCIFVCVVYFCRNIWICCSVFAVISKVGSSVVKSKFFQIVVNCVRNISSSNPCSINCKSSISNIPNFVACFYIRISNNIRVNQCRCRGVVCCVSQNINIINSLITFTTLEDVFCVNFNISKEVFVLFQRKSTIHIIL